MRDRCNLQLIVTASKAASPPENTWSPARTAENRVYYRLQTGDTIVVRIFMEDPRVSPAGARSVMIEGNAHLWVKENLGPDWRMVDCMQVNRV